MRQRRLGYATVPNNITSISARSSAISSSSTAPTLPCPALLTTTSIRPNGDRLRRRAGDLSLVRHVQGHCAYPVATGLHEPVQPTGITCRSHHRISGSQGRQRQFPTEAGRTAGDQPYP